MPPVQAGMVPAALPPFSAPKGVRLLPSLAASWVETCARALLADSARATAALISESFFSMWVLRDESVAGAGAPALFLLV
ncbi:hypothetical protein FQZ97_397570 [compost metagenome]